VSDSRVAARSGEGRALDDSHHGDDARPSISGIGIGEEIGPYVIESIIARSGNGVVLRASDPRLGRGVAIKLIDDLDGDMLEEHLVGEARALAQLSHPNILPVFDLGLTADGRVWVAMELVQGKTLDEWAVGQPKPRVLDAWLDVGRAIVHAHGAGVLHRDIKPGNVMVDVHGRARVLDFGLARDFSTANIHVGKHSKKFFGTRGQPATGEVIGTMDYMAPELFRGGSVTQSSDQFSYCISVYRALFERDPFDGAARGAWVKAAPAAPRALGVRAEFSAAVEAVLLRGLHPDPAQRWPSMAALCDALAESVRESPMNPFEPVRARVQLGAVMIALSVALLSIERAATVVRPRGIALASVLVTLIVCACTWRWRSSLFRTPFSRMLTSMVNLVAATALVHRSINWIDQVPVHVTLRSDALMVAAGAAYVGIFHDRLFFVAVVTSTLAALGCALAPAYAGLVFGLSQAIAIVVFAFRAVQRGRPAEAR
jgi:serine/threonine-protein kinase